MKRSACICATLIAAISMSAAGADIEAEPSCSMSLPSQTLPNPQQFVTHHQVTIGSEKIVFTVTAGETYLYDDAGSPVGSMFSYAYVKDTAPESRRPVIFITGGGPGSASHFLHVGFVGPWSVSTKRVAPGNNGGPDVVPPFGLVDNPNSLLDVADLVFIDPIGTGYSRAIGCGKGEQFWGVDEDLDSLAQFIQLWLTRNGRWNSAKFFLGESYGGTRAALIPDILAGGPSYPGLLRAISLNGVIVLVNTLGWPLGAAGIGPIWTAATDFPNQAAAAWYHNRIDRRGRTLQAFYEEVTQFAMTQYADALRKEASNALTPAERAAVVAKLVEFTGLGAGAFDQKLALPREEFSKLLLADQDLDIGMYDSRFTFPHDRNRGDVVADDAALGRSFPILTGAFLEMEHTRLKVNMDRPFVAIHWRDLLSSWNFARRTDWSGSSGAHGSDRSAPAQHGDNAEDLATAMRRNRRLYAMVATGYYDLLMSPAQARFATERAGIPKERLILEPFEAGHEPYLDAGVARLADDIRAMIRKASE